MGASELRDLYLKTENYLGGEYFARMVKVSEPSASSDTCRCLHSKSRGTCDPLSLPLPEGPSVYHPTQASAGLLLLSMDKCVLWADGREGARREELLASWRHLCLLQPELGWLQAGFR